MARTFVLDTAGVSSILLNILAARSVLTTGSWKEHRVICVCLDVFLEVLWTLESLAAKLATVRLQWDMHTDVGCNVVAFDDLDATGTPRALQVEVIGALATDVAFADVIL